MISLNLLIMQKVGILDIYFSTNGILLNKKISTDLINQINKNSNIN